jgi:hypothetical protein
MRGMNMPNADELNQLATKIAEAEKYSAPVSHSGSLDWEAIHNIYKGLDKLYQPLAEKYSLDIDTVLMFRSVATDWSTR